MICLTGDLHHATLRTGNQQHADDSEIRIAARFLRLLEERDLKMTFFISGRSFDEEWEDLVDIVDHPLVEFGGHNYSCFTPAIWHRFWNKAIGSYNGPRWYQRLDAQRTIRAIERRTGKIIRLWRNHMYMHGPYTEEVLSSCGIVCCSDGVQADASGPTQHPSGIWNFPLNVIPDHEHIYHAERTPEWVRRWQARYAWSDDFGPDSYYVDEWVDRVLECLARNEARGAVSNMIIHPITLYLADRFASVGRILDFLAEHRSLHVTEALDLGSAQTVRL
jgi:peptidoglycan/xylan/chitin deacetylase (PgdA/CDA1 family)